MPANKPKNRTFVTVKKGGREGKRHKGQTKRKRRGTTRHPV